MNHVQLPTGTDVDIGPGRILNYVGVAIPVYLNSNHNIGASQFAGIDGNVESVWLLVVHRRVSRFSACPFSGLNTPKGPADRCRDR